MSEECGGEERCAVRGILTQVSASTAVLHTTWYDG